MNTSSTSSCLNVSHERRTPANGLSTSAAHFSSRIHKTHAPLIQSVTTSVTLSPHLHLHPSLLSLSLSPSLPVSRSVGAVSYVSYTAAAAAAAEREDTHERTTPHLPETAVLSRKYTSARKKHMSGRASQGENEWGERERERDGGTQGEDGEDGGGVIIMFTVSLRTQETENHPAVDKRCVEMLNLLKIKEAFYRF